MSSTNVAYMPADQAAQYVDCELLGKPLRIGSTDYYPWSAVEALRHPRPAEPTGTRATRKARPAESTGRTSGRASSGKTQPASTGTSSGTRVTSSGTKRTNSGRRPAPAPAPVPRERISDREACKTTPTVSEELSAPLTTRLAARLREPASAGPSGRRRAPSLEAGSRAPRPYPIDPEQEVADLAERPRAELALAAIALGVDPAYLRAKTIARKIVDAKVDKWNADQAMSAPSTQDELAPRRNARAGGGRQKTAAKVPTLRFSHGGR